MSGCKLRKASLCTKFTHYFLGYFVKKEEKVLKLNLEKHLLNQLSIFML